LKKGGGLRSWEERGKAESGRIDEGVEGKAKKYFCKTTTLLRWG